jgi:hypothetical protein
MTPNSFNAAAVSATLATPSSATSFAPRFTGEMKELAQGELDRNPLPFTR